MDQTILFNLCNAENQKLCPPTLKVLQNPKLNVWKLVQMLNSCKMAACIINAL